MAVIVVVAQVMEGGHESQGAVCLKSLSALGACWT